MCVNQWGNNQGPSVGLDCYRVLGREQSQYCMHLLPGGGALQVTLKPSAETVQVIVHVGNRRWEPCCACYDVIVLGLALGAEITIFHLVPPATCTLQVHYARVEIWGKSD